MALHLIVDGYNLMGLRPRISENWEAERRRLTQRLTRYAQTKGHPVTVVFDGWRSDNMSEGEERLGPLTVIYSRSGEKADQVIIRLAGRYGRAGVVVSSDREVSTAALAAGCVALRAVEFERRLAALPAPDAGRSGRADDQVPLRPATRVKLGNPKRLSKTDRQKRKRLAVL